MIVGAQLRGGWRWATTHLYALLILSPLVLGLTVYSATRWAESAAGWQFAPAVSIVLALAAAAGLIGASLSRAVQEIYHPRRPESVIDHLPVAPVTQFHAALVVRFARTILAVAALFVLTALLRGNAGRGETFLVALVLTVVIALSEVFTALNWIHWSHVGSKWTAAAALLVLSLSVVESAWFVLSIVRPEALPDYFRVVPAAGTIAGGWALVLYWSSRRGYVHWRAADLEFAKRLPSAAVGRRDLSGTIARRLKLKKTVRALLGRDLRLTGRVFSSMVYAGAGLAALEFVAVFAALSTNAPALSAYLFEEAGATSWLLSVVAVKLICVAATVSLGALLTPALVSHEISRLWLERACGTVGADLWQAKLWYTRIITLPAPLVAWLIALAAGAAPVYYSPLLLAECLWAWWIVSTLVGSLAYEMPGEPLLASIVMITAGVAAGALTALFWPLGLAIYGFGVQSLAARGRSRAGFHLLGVDN